MAFVNADEMDSTINRLRMARMLKTASHIPDVKQASRSLQAIQGLGFDLSPVPFSPPPPFIPPQTTKKPTEQEGNSGDLKDLRAAREAAYAEKFGETSGGTKGKKHVATSPPKADRQPEMKRFRNLSIPNSVGAVKKVEFAEPAAVKIKSVSNGTLPHLDGVEDGEGSFGDGSHSLADSPSQSLQGFGSSPLQTDFTKGDHDAHLTPNGDTCPTSPPENPTESDSTTYPFAWYKPGLAKTMLSWRDHLNPPLSLNSSAAVYPTAATKILSITFWNTGTSSRTSYGPSSPNHLMSLTLSTTISSITLFQITLPPNPQTPSPHFPHGFRTHAAPTPVQHTAILIHSHAAAATNAITPPWHILTFSSSAITSSTSYSVDPYLQGWYRTDTHPGFPGGYAVPRPGWHVVANTAAVGGGGGVGGGVERIVNMDFERAGGLPLVDAGGGGGGVGCWGGFVEAVGKGEGGVSVVYGREG